MKTFSLYPFVFVLLTAMSFSMGAMAQVAIDAPPAPQSSASAPQPDLTPADFPADFPPELLQLLFGDDFGDLGLGGPNATGSFGGGPMNADLPKGETVGQITLVDENPFQVIALLQNLTGKPVLVQQGLPGVKINFSSSGPLKRVEAIAALEGVLALNGIAITPVGENFLRAVPVAAVTAQAPAFLEGSASDYSPSNQIYSKFYHLDYLAVGDAMAFIQPFLSPGFSTMTPFDKQQMILITDALVNLQHIEAILKKIDKPSRGHEKPFFITLKNAGATDVKNKIMMLQDKGFKNRIQGTLIIEADDRTNQLLVFTNPANLTELDLLIKGLDGESTAFTYSEAFKLCHAEALKAGELIKEIMNNQRQAKDKKAEGNTKKEDKLPAGGLSGGANLEFSDNATVVADERGNAIIAYGTRSDLAQFERLVKQVDVLLPQVRIEVIISEVSLTDGSKRGIDEFDINYNAPYLQTSGGNVTGKVAGLQKPNISAFGVDGIYTAAAGFAGVPFSLESIFRRAQSNQNIRILSAPTIVTTHNKEATIEVIEQRPILKDTITDTNSNQANNTAVRNSIDYKDIGTILKIKPLIGPNGVIQLEIDQEISTTTGFEDINGVNMPVVGKRQARSFVSAIDQEVIILGGLRQNEITYDKGKIFLFGDLPIIGPLLFSPLTKSVQTKEIVIFIKPYLVGMPPASTKPVQAAEEQVAQMIDLSANREELLTFISEGRFPDIPPTDMCRWLSTILPDPDPCPPTPRTPTADIPIELDKEPEPVVPGPADEAPQLPVYMPSVDLGRPEPASADSSISASADVLDISGPSSNIL